MNDLISRQAAIDLFPNDVLEWDTKCGYVAPHVVRRMIEDLPSVQQEPEEFEWCHDCKEYDQERHCCHRWTKVIRNTVEELKRPQWISVSERLPEYFEPVITWDGHCYFVEKRIPYIRDDDGNPIKSTWWVSDDYDEEESEYYPNLRDGAAIAWMPLLKPYEVKE